MSRKTNIVKQIDLLISQEKNTLLGSLREGDRLEDKLAQFMTSLQQQIDTLIETKKAEQLAAASEISDEEAEVFLDHVDEADDEAEKAAMQLLEKEFKTYNIKQANGIMKQHKRSPSYIVKQSLIGSAVAAGLLWFFFPQTEEIVLGAFNQTPAVETAVQAETKAVAEALATIEPVAIATQVTESQADESVVPEPEVSVEPASAESVAAEEAKPAEPVAAATEEITSEPVAEVKAPVLTENTAKVESKVESLLEDTPELKPVAKVKKPETAVGQKLKVTAHVGNARNAPNNKGKRVARVKMGDVVIKMNEQMGWYQVKLQSGTVAWVYNTIFAPRLQVSVGVGNIRKAPNGKARIVSRIKQGDYVTKLEEKGAWYLVKLDDGTKAWGHRSIF